MTFRRWEKSDNEVIERLERENFADPWNKRMLDSCFSYDNFYGLVDTESEVIAGYVGAVYSGADADIMNVCVDAPFRRRGIARALMTEIIKYLGERGVENVFLEVRRSNATAISLYEKLGFIKVGERKRYYENTEDALVYVLTVKGE